MAKIFHLEDWPHAVMEELGRWRGIHRNATQYKFPPYKFKICGLSLDGKRVQIMYVGPTSSAWLVLHSKHRRKSWPSRSEFISRPITPAAATIKIKKRPKKVELGTGDEKNSFNSFTRLSKSGRTRKNIAFKESLDRSSPEARKKGSLRFSGYV
ncbi:MAG: hypothetical protein HQ519_01815 [Planctomycetes bacterium]|nr:hypothetical protein [Planctomycetota bacterium]